MIKKYYLAYGSNLNLTYMYNRCSQAKVIGKTILDNYRLIYKGRSDFLAYLTIEKCINASVPLALFEITPLDEKQLDIYEGYPYLYDKCSISIEVNHKEENALIYIMQDKFDYHLPSWEYVKVCKDGYDIFGFDKNIIDQALDDTIFNIKQKRKNLQI